MKIAHSKTSGFTLIELLVAISIIAIISTIGMVMYTQAQKIARDGKRRSDLQEIQKALEQYYAVNRAYPNPNGFYLSTSSGAEWLTGLNTSYFPRGVPKDPINTGNPYPGTNGGTDGGYGYTYYSGDQGSIPGGSIYMLITKMESPNAEDKKSKCVFGSYSYGSTNSGATSYIIPDSYMLCSQSQ